MLRRLSAPEHRAERGGFEPPEPFDSSAFKAGAFVRSATVPPTNLPLKPALTVVDGHNVAIMGGPQTMSDITQLST